MTTAASTPTSEDPIPDPPTKSRRRAVVGAAMVLVIVVAVGGVAGWRWHADRAYVGTEVPATVRWGSCFNSVSWTDPSNGVEWWAGHDPIVTGRIETEPAQHNPGGGVAYMAKGTMRFTSYDTAIFTNTAGGTIAFTRPPPDGPRTADCLMYPPGQFNAQQPPASDYTTGVQGTLREEGGPAPGLSRPAPGSVRAMVDNTVVATTSTTDGSFRLFVAPGTYTLVGNIGIDCPGASVTISENQIVNSDITCSIK